MKMIGAPMKEAELRMHATCGLCKKPIMNGGLPLFWRITIERFGIDVSAAKRQDGLAQLLGSSALANVMGTDADMASPVMEPTSISVCEPCAMEPAPAIAHMGLMG